MFKLEKLCAPVNFHTVMQIYSVQFEIIGNICL